MRPLNKKRKLAQPDAIVFDPSARQEYLTGFHKRKEQRKKHAQDVAAKQDKEEKLRERRQIRQQRKLDLEKHMDEFNIELRKQNPDMGDAESSHESDDEYSAQTDMHVGIALIQRDDYVQEDKYTTVTVEPMGETSEDETTEENAVTKPHLEGSDSMRETAKRPMRPKTQAMDDSTKVKKKKKKRSSVMKAKLSGKQQDKSRIELVERRKRGGRRKHECADMSLDLEQQE